jgi:hypothetical protein
MLHHRRADPFLVDDAAKRAVVHFGFFESVERMGRLSKLME